MAEPRSIDGYDEAAATKLWSLLPAVHRSEDSQALDEIGPLHELMIRLGRQVGVVRRSLDRLWEDQSIESCDDWVIPYLAELLDTNLVPAMQARGHRLDVANTIGYRRRKGTVGLVEQLAADVTGWECRAVEMFRRLARTRHLLDPEIGRPADTPDPGGARRLQRTQGLTGLLTMTVAGGRADLRQAAGAAAAHGTFDEYHHRLDVRRGEGALGWYGIPKLALMLWQHVSLEVDRATPVAVDGCPGHYTFDPTGRLVALWQADNRPLAGGYGESWRPLAAWQVPGPLTQELSDAVRGADELPSAPGAYPDPRASLWPGSLAVRPLDSATALDEEAVDVWPEVGRFALRSGTATNLEVGYHHGLFSRIGAERYDRRRLGVPVPADPAPETRVGGGTLPDQLREALLALGDRGTVVVTDGLTSTAVAVVGPIADVAIRADDERRAVIRLERGDGPWVLQGAPGDDDTSARLRLEGLLLSGEDIVLRGGFDEVVLSCCTIDPGTRGDLREQGLVWNLSVDGRNLDASRIWIEGTIRRLAVDRCITGPIRTRYGGVIQELCVNDSVVQGLPDGSQDFLGDRGNAIASGGGIVSLVRCTVLGTLHAHRLECSESILDDVATVDDVQDGCVRFSAWATRSTLPRRYASVRVAPRAPLFVSRHFGEAGYAQLVEGADEQILGAATAGAASITSGSHDGSEMGVFCRDGAAIKVRSLLIKLKEYLPVGLTPVLVAIPPSDADAQTTRGRPWPPT